MRLLQSATFYGCAGYSFHASLQIIRSDEVSPAAVLAPAQQLLLYATEKQSELLAFRLVAGGAILTTFLCGMGMSILLEVFDFADLRRCLASTVMASPGLSALVGEASIATWKGVWGGLFPHASQASLWSVPLLRWIMSASTLLPPTTVCCANAS